jgi:hypothetical protein
MAKARAKGRPIAALELSAEERTSLERQVRRHRVARSTARSKPAAPAEEAQIRDAYRLNAR